MDTTKTKIQHGHSTRSPTRVAPAVARIQKYLNKFDPKDFTVNVVDANSYQIRIMLDVSDEDGENFYLVFDLTSTSTHVTKTNIPFPVFLQQLTEKYKNISDVKKFVQEVSHCVKAYLNRKKQVKNLQERYENHLFGNVENTFAYDYVEFSVKLNPESGIVTMGMCYDMKDIRPSEIKYHWNGLAELAGAINNKIKTVLAAFKQDELAEAFNKVILL